LNFAYKYESLRSVYWVHSGSKQQFLADYRQIAALAKIPGHENAEGDKLLLIVRKWLEGTESGNWVLVVDNADNKLDVFSRTDCGNNGPQCDLPEGLSAYISQGPKGIVAITTRDMEVTHHLADSNVISKERMDLKDAEALFRNNYPRRQKIWTMGIQIFNSCSRNFSIYHLQSRKQLPIYR
jgi:hypothetical protein